MSLFPNPQGSLGFPQPLTEKYRPKRIADFIGLADQKRIYQVKLVRVVDSVTGWTVSVDHNKVLSFGSERMSLDGAKAVALSYVPNGEQYTLEIDTPQGVRFSGPFVREAYDG